MLEPLKAGEVVDLSARKLAKAMGVGKSTAHRMLRDLANSGGVLLATSAAGTRLALV